MLTIACTKAAWVRSSRETTCERAENHSRSWAGWYGGVDWSLEVLLILNWERSSSKSSPLPCAKDYRNLLTKPVLLTMVFFWNALLTNARYKSFLYFSSCLIRELVAISLSVGAGDGNGDWSFTRFVARFCTAITSCERATGPAFGSLWLN